MIAHVGRITVQSRLWYPIQRYKYSEDDEGRSAQLLWWMEVYVYVQSGRRLGIRLYHASGIDCNVTERGCEANGPLFVNSSAVGEFVATDSAPSSL